VPFYTPKTLVVTFYSTCGGNRFYWSDPEVSIPKFLEKMIKIKEKAAQVDAACSSDSLEDKKVKLWQETDFDNRRAGSYIRDQFAIISLLTRL
jgi:hypothetical protein